MRSSPAPRRLLACGGGSERYVSAPGWLRAGPGVGDWYLEAGAARENAVVTTLEAGDAVELVEERETFSRVRTAAGKEGWIPGTYLVPASGTTVAVSLAPVECRARRLFASPLEQRLEVGRLLFVRRSLGAWRLATVEGDCRWVSGDAISIEPDDVEVAKLVLRARTARKRAEVEALLARARQQHPSSAALALADAYVASQPRRDPAAYEPPALTPGEVPRSSPGPEPYTMPVPDEFPGTYVGDPAFDVRTVQTSGQGWAVVKPRFAVDWKPLAREWLPSLALSEPPAAAAAPAEPWPAQAVFRAPPPLVETSGRWYLATRKGVFAAKAAVLQGRVRQPLSGGEDFRGELLLRPAPEGGAGFAFWSPGARQFRAGPEPVQDPRYRYQQVGVRSEPAQGGMTVLWGPGAGARRAFVARRHAPVLSAYRFEMFPGGEFLFVGLEDTSHYASNVEPKWCRPALLLRAADLAEVARAECEPHPPR